MARRRSHDRLRWGQWSTDTVPPDDVLDATLYHQEWRHDLTGVITRFGVCAYPEQATDAGMYRLFARGMREADIAQMRLVKNERLLYPSRGRIAAVLMSECDEEREQRERAFRRRHIDGPSDPDLDAVSASEAGEGAYEAHREGRR